MNGVKGYEEIDIDRMYDLKTMETVRGEVVRNEGELYAQAHYRSWPS